MSTCDTGERERALACREGASRMVQAFGLVALGDRMAAVRGFMG